MFTMRLSLLVTIVTIIRQSKHDVMLEQNYLFVVSGDQNILLFNETLFRVKLVLSENLFLVQLGDFSVKHDNNQ